MILRFPSTEKSLVSGTEVGTAATELDALYCSATVFSAAFFAFMGVAAGFFLEVARSA